MSRDTELLALVCDYFALLLWSKTKDGAANKNRPESILERLQGIEKKPRKPDDVEVYETPEDFMRALADIQRRGQNGRL